LGNITIRVKVLPGLSEFFDAKETDAIVLKEKTEESATVGDIIRKLAAEHETFSATVFDAKTQEMTGYMTIVLNDRLVESLNGLDTLVRDGDVITLFPVIAGG